MALILIGLAIVIALASFILGAIVTALFINPGDTRLQLQEILIKMSEILDAVAAAEAGQAELKSDVATIKAGVAEVLALLTGPDPDIAAAVTRLQALVADQQATDVEADAIAADLDAATP